MKSLFGRKGHVFWGPKPEFDLYSGDTLALNVPMYKCIDEPCINKVTIPYKAYTNHKDDNFQKLNNLT